ncbi:hypothetical protein F183_A18740 [Bryobacterales bacterium F-183]|nr:hypothetical protein F183_A18740 [Bryobacterales bacterium F-183]
MPGFDFLKRKPFRIVAFGLAGFLLLIVGLFAVLSTEPARRWALDQLTARLVEEGIGFRAKRLELRALSLMASVEDVSLYAIGKEETPFARAKSVSVWLLWNFGFQKPSISSIELDEPAIDVRFAADGSSNLPVLKPSNAPSGKPISIGKIVVTGGSLRFADVRQALTLVLPRLGATVNEIGESSYRVDLAAEQPGDVTYRGNRLSVGQLAAKFEYLPKQIRIESARLESGGVKVAVSGTVQDLATADLHVESSGDVELLAGLAGYGGRIRGGHAANVNIRGPFATPSVAGTLNASNFWYDGYGPLDGGARFSVDGALTRADIQNIQAKLGSASVDGTANLALKAGAGESKANVRFGGLTSDLIARLGKVSVPVSTTARGAIAARFPAVFDQNSIQADASLHLDAGAAGGGRLPVAGDIDVQVRNGVGAANIKSLQAAGAVLAGMVRLLPREQIGGDLKLNVAEASGTVASLRQAGLIPATVANDLVQGPMQADLQLSGPMRDPRVALHATSSGLRLASTVAGTLDVRASGGRDVVDLQSLRFEISPEDRLVASGRMNGTALDFRGDLRHTSLRRLLVATGSAKESPSLPDGALAATFQIGGTTAKPVVTSNLESNNLAVLQQRLGTLQAAIRYADNAVAIERLQLTKGGGSISAAGSFHTQTKQVAADANIRAYAIDTLQLADGTTVRMTLNGTARTQGTAENATSTVDVQMTDVAVRGYTAKNAALRAQVAGTQLNATLQIPDWKAEAGINASLKAPMPAQVTLALSGTSIDLFTPEYAGNVTAVARGTLSLDSPEATLKGVAELRNAVVRPKLRDSKINPGELRIEQAATANFDGKYVDLTPLTVIASQNASKITISGHIPISDTDRTGVVKVNGDVDLDWVSRSFPVLAGGAVRGRLLADAVLTGGGKEWNPTGSVELARGEVEHESLPRPVSDINIRLGLRDRAIETESATARFLGGLITLGGRVPFGMLLDRSKPSTQPFTLGGSFEGLQLGQLAESLERPMTGEASFRVDVSGAGLDPALWNGSLQTSALRVRIADTDFEQKTPLNVTLANSLATIRPFTVSGPETTLNLSGTLSLKQPNPLNLQLDGNINAAITQLFTNEVRAEGDTKLNVAITGTLAQPQLQGRLELAGVQAEIPSATAVVENLRGAITFDGQRISAPKIEGELNGGTLTATGLVNLKGREISSVEANVTARGTSWNVPEGLQTAADADIKITGSPATAYNVTGAVKILDGVYAESLVIERGLFKSFDGASAIEEMASANGRQTPILLDIRVNTVDPILVENELLNGELTMDVRVTGSTRRIGLVGRLDVNEGASFYIGGRNYLIDRGAVTFANQNKIEPILDVLGRTRAGGYDINLQARGTVGGKTANDKLDTNFTSDPPLPQADIISLLVSGRRLADLRGSQTQVAQDQALSYLSGNLASSFSRQANRALGFNLPRIDPGLIADEAEPTARLTLGQDATEKLGLVYSINLRNSADQIWVGRYDITKRFQTRAVRQSDNSFRFQFQHNVEFGGVKPPESSRKNRTAAKIGQIQVVLTDAPNNADLQKRVRSKLGLKEGKTFDFFALRKGVDRIKNTLADDSYPEARVRASRTENNGLLDVRVDVQVGPQVEFRYEGDGVDRKARAKVADAWAHSSFDSLRIRSSTTAIREELAKDRYFTPDVEIRVTPGAKKQVVVNTQRGPRYDKVELALRGSSMEKQAIEEIAPDEKTRQDLAVHLEKIGPRLERFYRDRGYLDAKARTPRVVREERTLRIVTRVTEGNLIRVGQVTHTGQTTLKDAAIYEAILLYPSQAYTAASVDAAQTRLNDLLATEGYNQANVDVNIKRTGDLVDLAFVIQEGPRRVVKSIQVEGNQHVSDNLARTQAGLKPDEIVTEEKLNTARRNLYATGAFNLADVEVRPQDANRTTGTVPSDLVLKLREVRPFEVRYGVLFDTERGAGGILDLSTRNILGSARTAGIRGRYDSRLQELRAYFEQPSLLRLPVKFVGTGFYRRELNDTFITDRKGGSAYLEYRWGRPYLFSVGYRNEQVHTFERNPDPLFPFDIRLRIAPVTLGFSRDTRDDLLDASRGSFTSHIAEYAPSVFGSELQYAKYFGQYFYYRPFGKPTRVPWANVMKNRFVYASGVRYGIAQGLYGQSLVPSERFFAGGPNSVRGFGQDRLGPFSADSPVGGESMFVVNNEMRFPLFKFFDGVAFSDIGQVYGRWRDFRPGDLRYTAGFGVRMRTPFFLLRLDYGTVLNRRPGDPSGRLYFGIGQAF